MMCHGEGGGVVEPITLFLPIPPLLPSSYSLLCTLSGGDVSIRMVWLEALSAITAMRGAAIHPVHQGSRLDGVRRGLSSRFDR